MEHISNLFSLKSHPSFDYVDTLLVTFVDESRIFRFDSEGDVEEVDEFKGMVKLLHAAGLEGGAGA